MYQSINKTYPYLAIYQKILSSYRFTILQNRMRYFIRSCLFQTVTVIYYTKFYIKLEKLLAIQLNITTLIIIITFQDNMGKF